MNLSDEVLMAYADGELDSKTRAEVEDAMAADPEIARRVAEYKALRATLQASYNKVLDEPIPDRLVAAARGRAPSDRRGAAGSNRNPGIRIVANDTEGRDHRGSKDHEGAEQTRDGAWNRRASDNVIPLRRRPSRPRSTPYWGAIAASFIVGGLAWHFGTVLISPAPVSERNGQLLASGLLDKALSTRLVQDQDPRSDVLIGVSFRSKDGSYCRTFQVQRGNHLAGLACRQQDDWKLKVLAQGDAPSAGHLEFRPAGSSLPAPIAQAVDQAIDGEPLDADAEARARDNQWRSR